MRSRRTFRRPIPMRSCTQLASKFLARTVFDLELEGVPVDRAGLVLASMDCQIPDHVEERVVCRNQVEPYVAVLPCDSLICTSAAGQPPTTGFPASPSSTPLPRQRATDNADTAAPLADEGDVAMDEGGAESGTQREEEGHDSL